MLTEFYGKRWNQERAWLCRLAEKTLHISASFPMSRVMSCLECMMWSNGSLIPSYIVNLGTANPLGDSLLIIWGLNDVESMSSNYWLIESGGAHVNSTSIYSLGSWEGCSDTFATTRGLRWALKVSDIRGYTSIPGVEGPNWAHIASDKYDLLSPLLFLDAQVKLVSSFDWAWWAGEDSSLDCLKQLPNENFMPPG